MPTTVTYPGVYIEEVPSGVRTIVGVATSITAFIGTAERGPTHEPIRCLSFADFQRTFGSLAYDHTLGYAVSQFFANGGSEAIVVRVPWLGASKATITLNTSDNRAVTLEAVGEGNWGNELQAVVDHNTSNPEQNHLFNLQITDTRGTDDVSQHFVEKFRNVSVQEEHPRFVGSVLEDSSTLVRVRSEDADGWPLAHPLENIPGKFDDNFNKSFYHQMEGGAADAAAKTELPVTGASPLIVEASATGDAGNAIRIRVEHGEDVETYTLLVKNADADAIEKEVSTDPDSENYITSVLEGTPIKVAEGAAVPPFRPDRHEDPTNLHTDAAEGGDGTKPTDEQAAIQIGDQASKTGIYALEKVGLFNLLCLPPLTRGGTTHPTAYKAALKFCHDNRAFLIVDSPADWTSIRTAENGVSGLRSDIDGKFTKNAAVFFPRMISADPLRENRPGEFVTCGAIAGIMASTDATRGVWKAPAGIEAAIGGVREFTVKMTDPENGVLNPLGINCLRNFPVYGNVVWGSRTLDGNDELTSEWKYLPVRRFTLFLEESLYRGTQWAVHEPNDEPLWAQIRLNVGAFMQGLFRKGALQGQSASDAYFVKCDSTTTTPYHVNLGILNIVVGFAPLKPAEFVVIQIQQIAGNIET